MNNNSPPTHPKTDESPRCAVVHGSAGLVLRLRAIVDENPDTDDCDKDEWLAEVCRQSADEIERLTQQLAASEWNASDLCGQRNRLRAFVIAMHGSAVLAELLSPNTQGLPPEGRRAP